MTIHVVTPCLNVAATIDRTIHSVVSQAGDFELHYHVQDGGSVDGTLEKLAEWQKRIETDAVTIFCRKLQFGFSSASDRGMYEGLSRGVAASGANKNAFLTWINGDDILMPGALAIAAEISRQFQSREVSWFAGAVAVLFDDLPIKTHIRKLPTDAIRAGLCDGLHWDFMQQEGTFFRRWLWDAVDPERTIAPLRLAGDWNLWRLFAHKANLVQTNWPMGCFRIRAGQMSASMRTAYMAEIDSLVAPDARLAALEHLRQSSALRRHCLNVDYATKKFSVVEETVMTASRKPHDSPFQTAPHKPAAKPAPRRDGKGDKDISSSVSDTLSSNEPMQRSSTPREPLANLVSQHGLVALDSDWQYPAITEKYAFEQMRARLLESDGGVGVTYVGFPWATLIDKLQCRAPDVDEHFNRFQQFCDQLPASGARLTVCQHILLPKYLHLFAESGITEIFWSHATETDVEAENRAGIRLYPFPLFPVQVPLANPNVGFSGDQRNAPERENLFCFMGARPNAWYLSAVRNWIIDILSHDPRGRVISKDEWHYQKIVYEHQILNASDETEKPESLTASEEFVELLQTSIFALCPSGSGPNSIRLWEAMGAGAIPVILADGWAPPGDRRLWEAAAVFCPETPEAVAALPDRLEAIAREPGQLTAMRHALRQLWLIYGPGGFTYDVEKRIAQLTGTASGVYFDSSMDTASRHLLLWAGRILLTEPEHPAPRMPDSVAVASASLPGEHPAVRHLDETLNVAAALRLGMNSARSAEHTSDVPLASPDLQAHRPPAVHLFGRHGHRTPLSYAPLRRTFGDRVTFVDDPAKADILMTGFSIDIRENAKMLEVVLSGANSPKVVIMSEEPLWDTVWSGDFTRRSIEIECGNFSLPCTVLNHLTSDIFQFKYIPYFLLTNDDFAARYATLISNQAARSPQELLLHWSEAPLLAAFFAEKRQEQRYAPEFPEHEIFGLSLFRTEVAQAVADALPEERVKCTGKGWGDARPRQQLPDWHLDKIAVLHNKVRILGAYENTHQKDYISEKIFDAFAVGAIPAYSANRNHRVFSLVQDEAMLNGDGTNSEEAAARIAGYAPDITMAEAWSATARRLALLFSRYDLLARERRRVVDCCLKELAQVLQD